MIGGSTGRTKRATYPKGRFVYARPCARTYTLQYSSTYTLRYQAHAPTLPKSSSLNFILERILAPHPSEGSRALRLSTGTQVSRIKAATQVRLGLMKKLA